MPSWMQWKNVLSAHWRLFLAILLPIILLPIPLIDNSKESLCCYVLLLMMVLWLTEAVPLAITALLPVGLYPIFGILSSAEVCQSYMKEIIMMFIGGMVIAISFEHCNLHKRMSLRIMLLVGSNPRWLLAGFMIICMILSMWLSNSATAAMIVPILDAVLVELENGQTNSSGDDEQPDRQSRKSNLRKCFMMGVAYACNLGGTGTLIGTGPNLILKSVLDKSYGNEHGITFASWMMFNIPNMILCGIIAWAWLQIHHFGFRIQQTNTQASDNVRNVLRNKYDELGPINFHEIAVLVLFVITALLWFFRAPLFITGWADYITDVKVKGSACVMIIVFIMFIVPSKPSRILEGKECEGLITWKVIQEKMPWSLVFLVGGGVAMGEGIKASGLSDLIGKKMLFLEGQHPALILFVITLVVTFFTEVASNTATASVFVPIVIKVGTAMKLHPLYLSLGVTISCSFAFMLPVATPPNAIVFEAGKMKIKDMLKAGIVMNILCIGMINLMINTYGTYLFDLDTKPSWATFNSTT